MCAIKNAYKNDQKSILSVSRVGIMIPVYYKIMSMIEINDNKPYLLIIIFAKCQLVSQSHSSKCKCCYMGTNKLT